MLRILMLVEQAFIMQNSVFGLQDQEKKNNYVNFQL